MALGIGNLAGAVNGVMTAVSKEQSVKSFIDVINDFGVQVSNNFEVMFSGLADTTFFITDISLPDIQTNYAEIYYNGRKVEVPINYDYTHDFSMTVINDAQGYIYSALQQFLISESNNVWADSGYTMTVKALTGDSKYKGMLFTLKNVRIKSISGLSFGQSKNEVSTFDVNCLLNSWTATPGALGAAASIGAAVNSIV